MKDLAESSPATARYIPTRAANYRRAPLPVLTVMYHPDVSRIGDYVELPELDAGAEVQLSRLDTQFVSASGGAAACLADPYVSRRPLHLLRTGRGYAVSVDGQGSALAIDGQAVDVGEVTLSREALHHGVRIELSGRVVLLLQLCSPPVVAPQDSELIGNSAVMGEVRHAIGQVGPLNTDVLILGESGTGKELVARAIHAVSPRCHSEMVPVNVAAIPASLSASELFGAEKGAFTGASGDRPGYFVQAGGGTLFLDEIGDAPLEIQAALLRALESREIQPVGGSPIKVDLRILSATDADLDAGVRDRSFKTALRHRLSGYEIRLPPLRGRRADIALLALHFLNDSFSGIGEAGRLKQDGNNPAAAGQWASLFDRLLAYDWPGNVRELRNVLHQIALFNRGGIGVTLPGPIADILSDTAAGIADSATADSRSTRRPPLGEAEVRAALEASHWEVAEAARQLGRSRQAVYRVIERSELLRKAVDIPSDELSDSYRRCGGELDQLCAELRVSRSGLLRRLRDMNLRWT